MIAGLLVMDPSLKIMIVTNENVAAHAFVKHFVGGNVPLAVLQPLLDQRTAGGDCYSIAPDEDSFVP